MKIVETVGKDIKLLFRSKGSFLGLILGPLLIILVVGLAFNNTAKLDIKVSAYAPSQTSAREFINAIEEAGTEVVLELDEETCIRDVTSGKTHACITFPETINLEEGNNNTITFYVDNSRVNIVYVIIDQLQTTAEFRRSQLSKQLTNDLLRTLVLLRSDIAFNINQSERMVMLGKEIDEAATSSQQRLEKDSITYQDIKLSDVRDNAVNMVDSAEEIRNASLYAINEAQDFVRELKDTYENISRLESTLHTLIISEENIVKSEKELDLNNDRLRRSLDLAQNSLDELATSIDESSTRKKDIVNQLQLMRGQIVQLRDMTDALQKNLELSGQRIDAIRVTEADTIVNPITTEIKPVTTTSTSTSFTFPLLIMLVVMFVSLLLSGGMMINEKLGRAFFRTFTTPTSEKFFIFSTYVSSMLVVTVQTLIILLLAVFFLKAQLFSNFITTLFILFFSASFFVLLGIFLGQLFSTREAVTMGTITVGSVFLFLSNLVLPLESLSPFVQFIARLNPYTISSEILKRSILFQGEGVFLGILALIIYSIIILVAIFFVQRWSLQEYVVRQPNLEKEKKQYKLKLGQNVCKNRTDLLVALASIGDADFELARDSVRKWLRDVVRDRPLARLVREKDRQGMIEALKEKLKR
ncbi:MAG: ABC transporter permease [Candidatus Woesearchaeota archaeon]